MQAPHFTNAHRGPAHRVQAAGQPRPIAEPTRPTERRGGANRLAGGSCPLSDANQILQRRTADTGARSRYAVQGMVGDILQPTHLLFILLVALLVLGPKRLPEVGKTLGSGLRDFRQAINGEAHHDDRAPQAYVETEPDPVPPFDPDASHASESEPTDFDAVAVEPAAADAAEADRDSTAAEDPTLIRRRRRRRRPRCMSTNSTTRPRATTCSHPPATDDLHPPAQPKNCAQPRRPRLRAAAPGDDLHAPAPTDDLYPADQDTPTRYLHPSPLRQAAASPRRWPRHASDPPTAASRQPTTSSDAHAAVVALLRLTRRPGRAPGRAGPRSFAGRAPDVEPAIPSRCCGPRSTAPGARRRSCPPTPTR